MRYILFTRINYTANNVHLEWTGWINNIKLKPLP